MTFIIIDAQYWAHAAHHVAPNLTRADGHPIGAVHGFTKRLLQFLIRPPVPFDAVAVVFDAPGKNWRHELLPTYKANRTASRASPGGSDLGRQLPLIHAATEALGVAVLSHPGQEADDIIATLAWRITNVSADDIVIVSSDKDLLQLVGPGVRVYDTHPARAESPWQDGNEIRARFGVWPHQIPDYLALVGDAADNIAGAPGIGPKSAAKILREHGGLENALGALAFLSPGDAERLVTAKRVATLSRRATFDVPIGFDWRFDRERALAMCDEHGFRQIRAIIEGEWPASGHTTREGETTVPDVNENQQASDQPAPEAKADESPSTDPNAPAGGAQQNTEGQAEKETA